MKNNQPPKNFNKSNSSFIEENLNYKDTLSEIKVISEELSEKISSLTYEESLKALDELLELLQNDTVPVEDLQRSYLLGNHYLDHCERLLNSTQQVIEELNQAQIQEINEK